MNMQNKILNHIPLLNLPQSPPTTTSNYQNYMVKPYFMQLISKCGIAIAPSLLTNSNYNSWAHAILVAMQSKNKLGFFFETIHYPPESDWLALALDMCNTMVMTWMTNSIEGDIAQSILNINTTHDIWVKLCDRYNQGDIFRVSYLRE